MLKRANSHNIEWPLSEESKRAILASLSNREKRELEETYPRSAENIRRLCQKDGISDENEIQEEIIEARNLHLYRYYLNRGKYAATNKITGMLDRRKYDHDFCVSCGLSIDIHPFSEEELVNLVIELEKKLNSSGFSSMTLENRKNEIQKLIKPYTKGYISEQTEIAKRERQEAEQRADIARQERLAAEKQAAEWKKKFEELMAKQQQTTAPSLSSSSSSSSSSSDESAMDAEPYLPSKVGTKSDKKRKGSFDGKNEEESPPLKPTDKKGISPQKGL